MLTQYHESEKELLRIMDELGGLEKKLEEVISLVKSFGAEDRVQAGIIWNDFSAQMQMIINSTIVVAEEDEIELRLDSTNETTSCSRDISDYSRGDNDNCQVGGSLEEDHQGQQLLEVSQESSAHVDQAFQLTESKVVLEIETATLLHQDGDEDESQSTINGEEEDEISSSSITNDISSSGGAITGGDGEEFKLTMGVELKNKPIEIKSWTCELCSESLENETELKRHLKLSHKKTFKCNECDASFSKKGNLNVHKRKHTGDRPFPCPKCTNRFTTSGNLRRHLLSHQGLKPYSCSHCQARFTEKRNLLIHVRTHTGEKPYECQVCHKKFAHSSVLAQHQSIHKNLKPHLCHQCGKSFTQKSQLKVHEKRHSGVKSHVCQFCDSSFTTRSDLLRHQKTHTGEKPFVCNQCGKSFARSYTLKDHVNTKHPVDLVAVKV